MGSKKKKYMSADIVVKMHCDVSIVVLFSPLLIYSNNIKAYYANSVFFIVNYVFSKNVLLILFLKKNNINLNNV